MPDESTPIAYEPGYRVTGLADNRVPPCVVIPTQIIRDLSSAQEAGLAGRVGLHSLPQAEGIYRDSCGMTQFGRDEPYYDLVYFQYTEQQAQDWLTLKGFS